jgi:UDPglucose 6-dehydrogenase
MRKAISVIGLGKLGVPMAACFASKGFRVVGVDLDPHKVESIRRHKSPVFEPLVNELLASVNGRLHTGHDIEAAVLTTDVTFIVVATPSEPDGGFSLRYVLPVCERIGKALRSKDGFHLVVLTSTVMPGSTGGQIREVLECWSGKIVGKTFGLCYNPEFIALGSVVKDFLNPDFLLIGESDPHSGEILERIYHDVCDNRPPAARLSFIDAEIAKLAVNSYVTTKISFINMLARICERLPGANVDSVSGALGLDSRIGPKYLKGAVSYGGPCFPRDNVALIKLAEQVGAPPDIARATDLFNRSQIRWLADFVQERLPDRGKAGVLGLAYKPYTNIVEEAPGFLLAQCLATRGIPVVVFDPAVDQQSGSVFDRGVQFAPTLAKCIEEADVVAIATPWPEFFNIPRTVWEQKTGPVTVIDCWRLLPALQHLSSIRYISLGTGEKPTDRSASREHLRVADPPVRSVAL